MRSPENYTWAWYPSLAIDLGGNPLALWPRPIGSVWPVRASVVTGGSWSLRTFLQEDSLPLRNGSSAQAVFVDPYVALAVWLQWNGSAYRVRANILHMQDITPPWVRIEWPYTGDVYSTPALTVTGWTEPGAEVWVNGAAAAVGEDGYFVAQVAGAPEGGGYWYLGATARDAGGNYGYSNNRLVFYQNPDAAREAERASVGMAGAQLPSPVDQLEYWHSWWPQILSAPNGVAYGTWYEYVYPGDQGYVARYDPGYGWSNPIHLGGEEGYIYGEPRMSMDRGGNLTVVWATRDYGGRWSHIWAFHWMAAGWVIGPYRLDATPRFAYWPDVGASPLDGRTLMVWQQYHETNVTYDLMGRWFDPATFTWTAPEPIGANNNTTDGPRVAFDGSGNAYVAARAWNLTGDTNIALVKYAPGLGWDNGTLLANTSNPSSFVSIDADRGGNLTLAWHQAVSTWYSTYSGRFLSNGSWSGGQLLWNDSWTWNPEVVALDNGYALVAQTATVNGTPDALVAVLPPGQASAPMTVLDSITGWGGGPKVSKGYLDGTARAHWDQYDGVHWRAMIRSYNFTTASWSNATMMSPVNADGNIPDVAPMPDGGYIALWTGYNTTLGYRQTVARRFTPPDVTPPTLNVTSPMNNTTVNTSIVRVQGTTDAGRPVLVNGLPAFVEANGSFAYDVAVVNGTNNITVNSWDQYGNNATVRLVVRFDDPDRRRIEQLEAENAALQQQLNLTNSSLWQALADQNAALLAELAAQNASLMAALLSGDVALLAELAAQNASLLQTIADLNSSLLAELAAGNAALTQLIADTNASLLAELASVNDALLQEIAATNATLFAQLAAQNASLLDALAGQNASLLAQLAAQDAALTQLIADTNMSLLAELAAQDAALTALIADTNMSLLASLAAQNDDLLARISSTNASLLAQLASTNASLWAKLTAENGALWASLNASRTASDESDSGQNSTITATQSDVDAVRAQAASAGTMALIGILIGAAGIAAALLAILLSRKRPPAPPEVGGAAPRVEGVEVVDVGDTPAAAAGGPSRGTSMGAESEIRGTGETEQRSARS